MEVGRHLGRGQRRAAAATRQVDPEVFLLNLRGRHNLTLRTEEGFRAAIQHFHAATRKDPTFAPCHVGLADGYIMLVNYGLIPIAEGVPPARSALDQALELDPGSAEAYRALAQLRWNVEFDWPGARQAYEHSLRLDPNAAGTHYWYGTFLGVWGRFEESFTELRRALELDPLSLIVTAVIGWTHYFAGEVEQALPFYEAALRIEPNFLLGRWFRGEALVELGRFPEGLAELEAAYDLSGHSARMLGYLGYAYGRSGREDLARRALQELEQRSRQGYVPPYFLALVHCGLGDASAALDHLDRAVTLPDSMVRDLKVDPPLALLRPEPRFRSLLARIGLT
jgi:tetratricopeptide (TPR) repeat protein